jgi:8-oxo-dGTP pyrophosphatase MutT (NUDIX family)
VRVLFIRRAEFESDPWSGQIAFPGGRAEIGDADLLQTALRETFEETGVDFSPDYELLGRLDDLHSRTVLLPNVFVRPFVIAVGNAPDFERSPEVAEVFWMPLSKLRDQGSWRMTTVHARGRELQVRACDFEGRIIWGMTERIISQLVTVLK